MKQHLKLWTLVLVFLFAITELIFSFGKNKFVYETYTWSMAERGPFRIYLPRESLALTNIIFETAFEAYARHTNAFGYIPKGKIRVIIYPNPIDFQQNNVMDWTSSGTGGFTEFVKGRVVIPYSPFYPDFQHVLTHELNHEFQGFEWGKGTISQYTLRDIDIPLWLIEGASEYNSIGLDSESEMMVADGVISGVMPSLMELSDLYHMKRTDYYYVYKEGQAFYDFISRKYGASVYASLNQAIAEERTLEPVLKRTFSKKLPELNAEFFDDLHKRYMPAVSNLDSPEIVSAKIMPEDSYFNMNPVEFSTNEIAWISDRKIYPSVVVYNRDKESLRKLFRGGFDEEYLEFQYGKGNHLSFSTNGILCFVSQSGGSSAVHLYYRKTGNTIRLSLPFRTVSSPEISDDGSTVLFSAVTNQQSDIFSYNIQDKKITRLTDDPFYDNQPRFLDNHRIVYASNRKDGVRSAVMHLFILNTETGSIEGLIDTGSSDEYPAVSRDKNLLAFVRMGVHPALMICNFSNNTIYQEIVPTGGVFTPSFAEKGKILYSAFHRNSYNIYEYTPRYSRIFSAKAVSPVQPSAGGNDFNAYDNITVHPYQSELSVDNLLFGLMINSSFGVSGLGMLTWSDLLGDDRYQLLMDTTVAFNGDFWNYLNFDYSYFSYKYRNQFGYRFFHYSNYFYELATFENFYDMEKPYLTTYGGSVSYSYPFTTFDRFQAEIGYRAFSFITNVYQTSNSVVYGLSDQNKPFFQVGYVHDATLEDITGPVDGIRYELLYSKSIPFFSGSMDYDRLIMDFRSYWMIFPGYSIAFRGVGGKVFSHDTNSSTFAVGGFNSVRGYDLWSFTGDTMFLFNFELRVPFIRDWTLGFPFPIRLPTIWGALFWDFGSAWNWKDGYQLTVIKYNYSILKDLKSGIGYGFRIVLLPGIKLMADFAAPYNGEPLPDLSKWQSFWQIGIDF